MIYYPLTYEQCLLYYVGMNAPQYTIRGLPVATDRAIRKVAHLTGTSINQVVVGQLVQAFSRPKTTNQTAAESINWLFGSGSIGDDVVKALQDDNQTQKRLARQELSDDY